MQYLLRFMRRGPISPRVHGILDYLLAAVLIAVPLAVDFHDDTATVLMLVLGGAATLLAIGTNWSTGIIRKTGKTPQVHQLYPRFQPILLPDHECGGSGHALEVSRHTGSTRPRGGGL